MADETQEKILTLLDLLSVEVIANRREFAEFRVEFRQELHSEIGKLRNEMHSGFERLDHRIGRVETRVEGVEDRLEGVEDRLEGVEDRLEGVEDRLERVEDRLERVENEQRSFRHEFERRIAPLER